MLVRYRGINNKGVLERPGAKWKVLRIISSTLKFQECQKSWKNIIPLFGETENWRPGAYFDAKYVSLHSVTPKRPELPYGAKYCFLAENPVFQFFPLLIPYWSLLSFCCGIVARPASHPGGGALAPSRAPYTTVRGGTYYASGPKRIIDHE